VADMNIKSYEGYYRDFIEKTPYMILVADENGLLFHVNEAWKRALGYPIVDDMSHTLWHFVHPYSRSLCQDNFRQAKPGECFDLEVVFTASDRSLVYTEGKFNCSYDAEKQVKIVTGIVQDVTIQNEQALEIQSIKYHFEEKNKYWNMLQKSYASLINEEIKHFDDNIINVLRLFGRMVYADRAFIFEFKQDDKVSTNTYEWCNRGVLPKKNQFVQIPFSDMDDWIVAHDAGEPYYIQNVSNMSKESTLRKLLEPQGIMSMVATPMMKDGKCYGCVGFDSVKVLRTDTELEMQILNDLGALFLFAIRRRQKYVDLHEKETRYRSYLKNAPVAIAVCDEKGTIHEANLATSTLTGYTQKELVGKKIKVLFSIDLSLQLKNCFIYDTGDQFTTTLQTKNGESTHCMISLTKANACEAILMFAVNESLK